MKSPCCPPASAARQPEPQLCSRSPLTLTNKQLEPVVSRLHAELHRRPLHAASPAPALCREDGEGHQQNQPPPLPDKARGSSEVGTSQHSALVVASLPAPVDYQAAEPSRTSPSSTELRAQKDGGNDAVWVIEDKSTNGILVNGRKVKTAILRRIGPKRPHLLPFDEAEAIFYTPP